MRGHRRHVAALAATALLAVPGLTASSAGVEPEGPSIITWNIQIDTPAGPSDTPCTIDVDLYMGFWVSTFNPKPAIIVVPPLGATKDDVAFTARKLAESNYGVLAFSPPGAGESGCSGHLGEPQWEGEVVRGLVDFLGGVRKSRNGFRMEGVLLDRPGDPRVGVIGRAYGGQVALAAAAVDPRIDAIAPAATWYDLAHSLAPNEAVDSRSPGVAKVSGLSAYVGGEAATRAASTGYLDATTAAALRRASVASYAARLRTPTLLLQGQTDPLFPAREAVQTYAALRRNGAPAKLVWHPHTSSGGTDAHLSAVTMRWFDRYLRRWSVSTGSPFEIHRPWTRSYVGLPSYPAFPLRGVPVNGPTSTFVAAPQGETLPLPTGGSTATAVTFVSRPLASTAESAGLPAATVRLTTSGPAATADPATHLVLFLRLYDVAPDGTATLVGRQSAPVRLASVAAPIRVALPAHVHRFAKGHRIGLSVAASDPAYRGNTVTRQVTVPAGGMSLSIPATTAIRFAG